MMGYMRLWVINKAKYSTTAVSDHCGPLEVVRNTEPSSTQVGLEVYPSIYTSGMDSYGSIDVRVPGLYGVL